MKKIDLNNLKNNIFFLVSLCALLCLLMVPKISAILILFMIFIVVVIITLLGIVKKDTIKIKSTSLIFTILSLIILFYNFYKTWINSNMVTIISNKLHISNNIFIIIIGLIGSVIGFLATYKLINFIFDKLLQFLGGKENIKNNLKHNWVLPISSVIFFHMETILIPNNYLGLLISFIIILVVACKIPSIWKTIKNDPLYLKIISFLSSLGITLSAYKFFYNNYEFSIINELLRANNLAIPISIIMSILSFIFIYTSVSFLYRFLTNTFKDLGLFSDLKLKEVIVYIIIIGATLSFVTFAFIKSDAFYGTEYSFDIIYTSDSPAMIKDNVYLSLTHLQNDLRQPLFSVFSAPFMGIPYLISSIYPNSLLLSSLLISIIQVILLYLSHFMLAKMLKLSPLKRVCFMIVMSVTYTNLLFSLMIEQYIVAYFYLILTIYMICSKNNKSYIALYGAGGTLLTSMILLPLTTTKSIFKNFKGWLIEMFKHGIEFIILILAFCRYDIISTLTKQITLLTGFTGKSLTLLDKFYQYTEFIKNCFVCPDASVNFEAMKHISWQLNEVTNLNIIGIIILVLSLISVIINRDKLSSKIAFGWIIFSVIILCFLGWGTKENGLILYSLYFGWAFFVLIFSLIEKIEDKLNKKFLIPLVSGISTITLIVLNYPAIKELLEYAIKYFSV